MKAKMNNVRGGGIASKKLLAAIAVLAVAFAVFAAVPVIADDSDAADGKTIYVDPAKGNDENDGTSADKALNSFDAAFEAATANDKVQLVGNYAPMAAATGENDITIPAGETLVVPTDVTLDCRNVKLTVEGTLEVTGTLTIQNRDNIAGAANGGCNIVIKTGATVNMPVENVVTAFIGDSGKATLGENTELVISKLNTKSITGLYGYTAALESGKLTLNEVFIVGPNTNLTIAEDATVEVNAKLTNNGSITNNGTLTIGTTGAVSDNGGVGKFTNKGEVVLGGDGTFTGTISGGKVTVTKDFKSDKYPTMIGAKFVDDKGIEYTVINKKIKGGEVYQYGLNVEEIAYDGSKIMDSELVVNNISLHTDSGKKLDFTFTVAHWYDTEKDEEYTGALRTEKPNAGTYEGVVRIYASVNCDGAFTGSTTTDYLDLVVTPAEYTGMIIIKGWNFGDYNEKDNGPSLSVKDEDGNTITEGYTVTYEFFTDSKCTKSAGSDPLRLEPGDYWVKATVTTDSPNYEINISKNKITFKVVRASEVEFHPIQDLDDSEKEKAILGGVNPDTIQENIKFNDIGKDKDGKYNFRVSGAVNKIATTIDGENNPIFTNLASLFGTEVAAEGYFLAFYIVGADGQELDANMIENALFTGTGVTAGMKVAAITLGSDVKNDEGYIFGIFYTPSLQADDAVEEPEAMKTGFNTTVDYDGSSNSVYSPTTYVIDTSFLNYYTIVLHDDKADDAAYYNDTLTYYRLNDAKFTLPSGAAEGFKYWATEKGVVNDRVFSFGSIMVVGDKYDADDDKTIDLYATYGSGSEPTPVEPTKGKIVVTGFVQDGKAYFTVIADDGLAIPAETLTVGYYYTDPVLGMITPGVVDTLKVESAQFATIVVDVPEGAITIFATFGDAQSNEFYI